VEEVENKLHDYENVFELTEIIKTIFKYLTERIEQELTNCG